MKKQLMLVLTLLVSLAVLTGCSKGYDSRKTVSNLNILLNAERYPLVKGDNTLSLKLEDTAGKPVSDASVDVRFYMPPMPGMAPMDYRIQPMPKGNVFAFPVNVPMEGGWKLEVTVNQAGKEPVTTIFNLDAR